MHIHRRPREAIGDSTRAPWQREAAEDMEGDKEAKRGRRRRTVTMSSASLDSA